MLHGKAGQEFQRDNLPLRSVSPMPGKSCPLLSVTEYQTTFYLAKVSHHRVTKDLAPFFF